MKQTNQFTAENPPEEYSANPEKSNIYSIHEAKTNLSKLVKRAAAGETIYIGAFGKPEVEISAIDQRKFDAELRAKAFGCMKGEMELYEGWDDPLPDDIIEAFYSMQGLEDFEKK